MSQRSDSIIAAAAAFSLPDVYDTACKLCPKKKKKKMRFSSPLCGAACVNVQVCAPAQPCRTRCACCLRRACGAAAASNARHAAGEVHEIPVGAAHATAPLPTVCLLRKCLCNDQDATRSCPAPTSSASRQVGSRREVGIERVGGAAGRFIAAAHDKDVTARCAIRRYQDSLWRFRRCHALRRLWCGYLRPPSYQCAPTPYYRCHMSPMPSRQHICRRLLFVRIFSKPTASSPPARR